MHSSGYKLLELIAVLLFLAILSFINSIWEMRLTAGGKAYVPKIVRKIYERRRKIYGTYRNFHVKRATSGHWGIGFPYLVNLIYTPIAMALIVVFIPMSHNARLVFYLLLAWPALSWIKEIVRVVIPGIFTES